MSASDEKKVLKVAVLSVEAPESASFVKGLVGETSGPLLKVSDSTLQIETIAGDPRKVQDWDERISKVDGIVLLARFLDVLSLDKIKAVYRRLPSSTELPFGVFIVREAGGTDFKMSCPACGQKLWVRDADVGKRGRCPNCKKAFKLQTQAVLLRSQLMLPDTVPVLEVIKEDHDACISAMESLVPLMNGSVSPAAPLTPPPASMRSATIQIKIESG